MEAGPAATIVHADDAVAVIAVLEHHARGLPDLESQFRRDRAVGEATNDVGAEVFASHADVPRTQTLTQVDTYRASLEPFASRNMCDPCAIRARRP